MHLLLFLTFALGAPLHRWVYSQTPDVDRIEARWTDAAGEERVFTAEFPRDRLAASRPLHFDMNALRRELVARMQARAEREAPGVAVRVEGTEVLLSARGPDAKKNVEYMRRAQAGLYDAVVADHHLVRTSGSMLQFDAPRLAAEAAPSLAPLVQALGASSDPRVFAGRALALVQGIPYDKVDRDSFTPPLALLRVHHGDCDEKSALFLALLRAAHPRLGLAMFTTEGHAWVGLDLPAHAGETTVDADGTRWLLAEPVGPALAPLGTLSPAAMSSQDTGGLTVRRVAEG